MAAHLDPRMFRRLDELGDDRVQKAEALATAQFLHKFAPQSLPDGESLATTMGRVQGAGVALDPARLGVQADQLVEHLGQSQGLAQADARQVAGESVVLGLREVYSPDLVKAQPHQLSATPDGQRANAGLWADVGDAPATDAPQIPSVTLDQSRPITQQLEEQAGPIPSMPKATDTEPIAQRAADAADALNGSATGGQATGQQAAAGTGAQAGNNNQGGFMSAWGRGLRGGQEQGVQEDPIDRWVKNQPNDDARLAAEQVAPLMRAGRNLGGLAAGLAVPAAVIAPTAMAVLGAGDKYGEAGAVASGVTTGVGALGGAAAGGMAGRLIPGNPVIGGRIGAALGALGGGGGGALVGSGVNTAAQAAVDRADAGRDGVVGSIGAALDALGYRSTNDVAAEQMRAMERRPEVQLMRRQEQTAKAKEREKMIEAIYLQALLQGIN